MTTADLQVRAVRELDALLLTAQATNRQVDWIDYQWARFVAGPLFGIEVGPHWPEGVDRPCPYERDNVCESETMTRLDPEEAMMEGEQRPRSGPWQPGDFDQIVGALSDAFAGLIGQRLIVASRPRPTQLLLVSPGRWELEVREKRGGNVVANLTPSKAPLSEDEFAALRAAAQGSRLAGALQSSGGWHERKLARLLERGEALV